MQLQKRSKIIEIIVFVMILGVILSLLGAFMVITVGGNFGTYSKTASQVAAAKYSTVVLLGLLLIPASLLVLLTMRLSGKEVFLLEPIKSLVGYVLYVLLGIGYLYEQIINQSQFINKLVAPFGLVFSAGSFGLWSQNDLLTTRVIETLVTGILVYYGFFAGLLFYRRTVSVWIIACIILMLMLVLVVSSQFLGVILQTALLFLVPFVSLLLLRTSLSSSY